MSTQTGPDLSPTVAIAFESGTGAAAYFNDIRIMKLNRSTNMILTTPAAAQAKRNRFYSTYAKKVKVRI